MLPFAGTIFISAFLLFQVQPLISRVILPWYGGTPAVWTTCMLFFQAVLLALVTYPAFFERYWTLSMQTWAWSGSFIVFALFCAYTAWLVYRGSRDETEEQRLDRMFSTQSLEGSAARPPGKPRVPPPVPSVGDHFLWVML